MAVDKTKNEPRIDADEVLGGIVEWVSIESPSHDAKSVNRVVDHVEGQFRDLGLKLDRTPGVDGFGDILECKTPWGEGKGILVLAHLDTVHPIGMIEKELKVRREGDSIFGPGIYDMKAGGYMAYYALRHLIRQGKKTKLPVTFLFIPEEEVGSPTSRARIEEAARGHKYALVMEPGRDGDKVVTSRKGVGRFTLTVKGKAAHAGVRHQDGRSAILEMAKQILRIEDKTDYARCITCNVGLIKGGVAKYGMVNPIFQPSPLEPRYTNHLIFEGISVDEDGKQYYLDAHVAYRRACLNAIEYMKKFGYTGEQAYAILGTAPVEGHISGIVDIPNACATVWLPTEIFDFDITPCAAGPKKMIKGKTDLAVCK